ncbi:hypothetical protein [Pseudomonas sp. PGPPP2]|uniref:hypothetical protein n=1 Tax=Pseudomonas sp. PGPPP2 TaxID=2015554 RepID=UPI000BCBBDF3|nr:hypothetical protein [Pseudomonas sp. PGPPP2]OYT83110.1 MAG: hypothetical protein CFE48_02190 [Pseudomonas sp. PGPPP2]
MTRKKTPKALLPPIEVSLLESPFEGDPDGAHGGIGLRHTEVDFIVYLRNPKDGVNPGSVAYLYWGNRNVPVASTQIREGEEHLDRIPLTVPGHKVVQYWANPVFGKLRRASGNESFTEERKYRVSLTRPGDRDPNSILPGHQGLVYVVPPSILLNGVSEVDALAGVNIIIRHWIHMHAYDLIILVWGSQRVLHRVQPNEVGRDITLTVDYATISAAGNSRDTRVGYQVRDAGGNQPDEWARWSATTLIDVHLNQIRPEAPWLAFPGTGTDTEIDLAELGSLDAQIQAWITSAEVAAYSILTLIWAGVDREGNSIPYTETRSLNSAGLYTFNVPNALVAAIADGSVSVHIVFQQGTIEQPSKKLYLDVVGEIVRWPAPQIKEDLGGHIEPDFAATVYFPLQPIWPANGYLEVIFRVSSPDITIEHRVGREVDDIPANPDGDMEFIVYPDELSRFDGHLVEVFYAHTRPGSRPQESLRLQVVVGQLQRTMPAPIIDKAISGQLNPDDIGAYAKVFAPFAETKRDDWIRMHWVGPKARIEVPVQVPVDGATTEHYIESYYVTSNLNETVTVFYTLKRGDEVPRYSQITEVLVSQGVGELPSPTLLEAQVTGPGTATLEPLKVQNGTKLVVTYLGMRGTDSIQVTMIGAGNGGSPTIPAKPGNEALQKVEFDITKAAIHANIRNQDTTVTFQYGVTRAGATVHSDILTVTVKAIPLAELVKTVLQINQANADTQVLDLSAFTGDARGTVGIWPFITASYPVWLRLLGKTASNVDHDRLVYNGAGASAVNSTWIANGKIEPNLPRSYLQGLGHGTVLKMEFKAAVSSSKAEAEALTFPIMEYRVNTLPAEFPVPKLTQATGTGAVLTLAPLNAQSGGTVSVEYTPMYTTDSIKVTMVGTAGAGSPVIAAKPGLTSGVVTFAIPATAIAANIGNINKMFTLKYEVTRAGVVRSSQVVTVTVTPIPQAELAKTVIQMIEANQTTKVLDLSSGTANRTLRVGNWPFIATSSPVWIEFRGFKNGGEAHNRTHWNGGAAFVNATWFSQGWWQSGITYASYLKELGHNTKLTLHFKAALGTGLTEADAIVFPVVEYNVNTLPAQFPVPKLTQATGTGASVSLAPLNVLNGGTVEVRYAPMYTTDSIKVMMVGTAGAGSPVIAAKSGLTSGVVTFAIPAAAIAANIGNTNKTFTLKYDVTRAGVVRSSQVVTVTVTPIPDANLPRPLINGVAHNGTLDIAAMTANASLAITPWPLQVAGKKVWLTFHCGGANPNPYNVWTGYAHPSASGIDHFVLLSWLKSCPNGNQIWVDFKVAYDPNAVEAGAVSFPRTVYTVKSVNVVDSTDFNNGSMNNWINYSSSGSIVGSGSGRYWQGNGSGQFPCGIVKFFNYGYLAAGYPYRITIDFAVSSNLGCFVLVETEGVAGAQRTTLVGSSSWSTYSFDFVPRENSSNRRLIITIINFNAGGSTLFVLDNIKIIKL